MAGRTRKITVVDNLQNTHTMNINSGTALSDVLAELNLSGKVAKVNGNRQEGDYCLNSGDRVTVQMTNISGA